MKGRYGQRQGGKHIQTVSFGNRSELESIFIMFLWNEHLRKNNLRGKRWKKQTRK